MNLKKAKQQLRSARTRAADPGELDAALADAEAAIDLAIDRVRLARRTQRLRVAARLERRADAVRSMPDVSTAWCDGAIAEIEHLQAMLADEQDADPDDGTG
jgi:hypothetical protein